MARRHCHHCPGPGATSDTGATDVFPSRLYELLDALVLSMGSRKGSIELRLEFRPFLGKRGFDAD